MSKLDLVNHLYKDYIETCIKLKEKVDIKVLDDIYRHAESIINIKRQGSIFKIAHLENFSLKSWGYTRKERASLVIKNLLRILQDHDYEKEIKNKIKPKMYKILIEVVFIENDFAYKESDHD